MDNFAEDPDPQAKADRALRTWSQLWSQVGRPDGSQLHALLARLDMTTVPAAMPHVDGHSLLRRARAASRKAAGCNGWAGRHWCGLPLGFFHKLADVWNMVLEGASIPASWTQVRVCLIDKEDGGQRPLAIAALAWRLGASVVVQKLASWIKLTFPEELYGGLPTSLSAAPRTSTLNSPRRSLCRGGGALAGCKADVRKCFDTADPKLAILCLRQLGAPDALLDVIGRFYDERSRLQPRHSPSIGADVSIRTLGLPSVEDVLLRVRDPQYRQSSWQYRSLRMLCPISLHCRRDSQDRCSRNHNVAILRSRPVMSDLSLGRR